MATMNGNPLGDPLPFILREGVLWVDRGVAAALGYKHAADFPGLAPLDSLPGTQVQYDSVNQTVAITAPLAELDLGTTVLSGDRRERPVPLSGKGVLLNYDLYATQGSDRGSSLSAATELRAFHPWGVLGNTMLTRVGRASPDYVDETRSWSGDNVRLDTAWTSSWPDRAVTLTVGDTFTGFLGWTRPTRIGGIRLSRDFDLQPYRITSPLPAFMGSAVLPSSVDLYIDGIRRYQGDVPAGPFQLDGIPSVTGHGNAQVVLTDALGRRTEIEIPFYASSTLLEEGLTDWSVETGHVRRNYGLSSFDYASEPVFAGTVRRGLTDFFTAEAHAEASRRVRLGGLGAVATLGTMGQVSASYAGSQADGGNGRQYSLGYQWQSRYFNFAVNRRRSDERYRDIASMYGSPAPARLTESAVAGANLGSFGTFSLSYVASRHGDDEPSRYAGAYWSKSLGRTATLSVSLNRNLRDSRDQSVYVGLNVSLDGRLQFNTSVQRSHGDTFYGVGAGRSAPGMTGWSWAVDAQRSAERTRARAMSAYRGVSGDYHLEADSDGSHHALHAGTSGSLVMMGGSVFAGRRVDDAFAVVSTSGIPHVPVSLQNNLVGRTDSRGMLMISPLNAYQANRVAIDPMQLPADVRIERVEADVSTPARSGAFVDFAIRPVRAAVVVLHHLGRPVPAGSTATLNDHAAPLVVGYDGMIYLEGLEEDNSVHVRTDAYSCRGNFDYRPETGAIPRLGPIDCE